MAARKISMGAGGYSGYHEAMEELGSKPAKPSKSKPSPSEGKVVDVNYTATFFKRGKKGDYISRTPSGKIIIPNSPVNKDSVWVGVLVDRGSFFSFKPEEEVSPGVFSEGAHHITKAGVLIQTARGVAFLPAGQERGINFRKYAEVVSRFLPREPEKIFVSRAFGEGLSDRPFDYKGFGREPADCAHHRWVQVAKAEGGSRVDACTLCGGSRAVEGPAPGKPAPAGRYPGLPGGNGQGGSKHTPKPSRRSRVHPSSNKGMHRSKVVHALKTASGRPPEPLGQEVVTFRQGRGGRPLGRHDDGKLIVVPPNKKGEEVVSPGEAWVGKLVPSRKGTSYLFLPNFRVEG